MVYQASGLNLVINAMVLRNTVYLSCAVDYVQGIAVLRAELCRAVPLPWAYLSPVTGCGTKLSLLWNDTGRFVPPKNFEFS